MSCESPMFEFPCRPAEITVRLLGSSISVPSASLVFGVDA